MYLGGIKIENLNTNVQLQEIFLFLGNIFAQK